MARIDFAPDGKHWQTIKKGKIGRMWDYFISNIDIQQQITLNPNARFRLVGDEKIIGYLPRER